MFEEPDRCWILSRGRRVLPMRVELLGAGITGIEGVNGLEGRNVPVREASAASTAAAVALILLGRSKVEGDVGRWTFSEVPVEGE